MYHMFTLALCLGPRRFRLRLRLTRPLPSLTLTVSNRRLAA